MIVLRILRRTGYVVLGILLYLTCMNLFLSVPGFGEVGTSIVIGVLVVFAAAVWLVDELRGTRVEPKDTMSGDDGLVPEGDGATLQPSNAQGMDVGRRRR